MPPKVEGIGRRIAGGGHIMATSLYLVIALAFAGAAPTGYLLGMLQLRLRGE